MPRRKPLTADGSMSWEDHEAEVHLAMTVAGGDYEVGWWAPGGSRGEEDRSATMFRPTKRKGRKHTAEVCRSLSRWGYAVEIVPEEGIVIVFPYEDELRQAANDNEEGDVVNASRTGTGGFQRYMVEAREIAHERWPNPMSPEAFFKSVGLKEEDVESLLSWALDEQGIPQTDEAVGGAIFGFFHGIQAGMALEELRLLHGDLEATRITP